ncbi:Fic family protein [Lentilactobacillus hilgardii]|uniref:cell filamentation protein Fic n=1 Tax=Lentilactobacillus hilgardii TaxID=1588 RepID=UPI0021C3800B|nr:cell filamentation protein Fic [Lentilactobacillus hilgardii]MCP9332839.1 cell filamentation protein Fic [Lentilactobacillus hilgardii]MCP9349412.1 cell filamentation protein Fic [Lentilactobacillus hilgardii]MCP9352316.1 cell filamentation protein Fic [Lentilactobacillus hilgardii]
MNFADKTKLTQLENQKLAIKEMIRLVYSTSRFEDNKATIRETETIILGSDVYGLSTRDMKIIRQLQSAVELIIRNSKPYSLAVSHAINGLVAEGESVAWGMLRTGKVKIGGTDYIPMIPVYDQVVADLTEIMMTDQSATWKALKVMLYIMHSQLYWDGNKRTALLSANYILIQNGAGLLIIDDEHMTAFYRLLNGYYNTGRGETLMNWLYETCIVTDRALNTKKESFN